MRTFKADNTRLVRRKLLDRLFRSACYLAAGLVVVILVVLMVTVFSGASTSLTTKSSLPRVKNDTGTSRYDGVTREKRLTIGIIQGTGPVDSTARIFAVDEAGVEHLIGSGDPRNNGSFEIDCEPVADGSYSLFFRILDFAGKVIEQSGSIEVVVDTRPPVGLVIDEAALGDRTLSRPELENFVIGGSGIEKSARVEINIQDKVGNRLGPLEALIKEDGRWRISKSNLQRIDANQPQPADDGALVMQVVQYDLAGNAQDPVEIELAFDRGVEETNLKMEYKDDQIDLSVLEVEPILRTNLKTFLTSHHFDNAPEVSGILRALVGSIYLCGVCAVFTIPIGIGTAIYLEDFKPRNRLLRAFHSFVQLNISNLAGVPSIVYGILGVTTFVYMFSLFPIKTVDSRPDYEFGAYYVYQLETAGGQICTFSPSDTKETFYQISEPIEVVGDQGPFMLNVVDTLEGLTEDEKYNSVVRGSIRSKASIIDSQHHWYYVSLPFGRSFLAAGMTLGLVVLPIIIIASQEAIRAVPNSLREASMGMGATKWQTVKNVVLPSATPGIMTGTILALSRAIGEAAPILAVMGGVLGVLPKNLMETSSALPILIYKWAKDASRGFHSLSAAAIVVLLLLLLAMNSVAIVIRYRAERNKK